MVDCFFSIQELMRSLRQNSINQERLGYSEIKEFEGLGWGAKIEKPNVNFLHPFFVHEIFYQP